MTRQFVNDAHSVLAKIRKKRFEFSDDEAQLIAGIIESSINECCEFVRAEWVALSTGMSKRSVIRKAHRGEIPGMMWTGKGGSAIRFEKQAVVAWMTTRNN